MTLKKLLFPLLAGLSISHFSNAQTTLNAGDVMLTGINAGNSDLSFVTWVDLQPGTTIHFTNNGWNSQEPTTAAANARNTEEIASWTNTSGNTIVAGSVIVTKTASPYTASIGTTTVFSNAGAANPMLRIQDGDQVTIYQTAAGNGYSANNSATATFTGKAISIHNWLNAFITTGTITNATTYLPSDLVGYSVHYTSSFLNPYIHYKGARSGSSAEGYKVLVMNPGNWQNDWVSPLNATAFTFGTLPVKLLSFHASARTTGIELAWLTAQEVNLLKFEVEYSNNAMMFTKAGEVPANRHTSEGAYTFMHKPIASSSHYYRLKMIDLDGSFSYSAVQRVQPVLPVASLSVKPNPVVDQRLTIAAGNLEKSMYTLQVSNATGMVVYKQVVNHSGGDFSQRLQLPNVAAGIYHLQVSGADVKLNTTIVVK